MFNFLLTKTNHRNHGLTLFLLRLLVGGFMLYSHGFKKFTYFFSDTPIEFVDLLGIGATATLGLVVFAEFICSALLIIGLLTRFALIPLIITMVYAIFVVHSSDAIGEKELPIFYLVIYVILFISGPGIYSLDAILFKKKRGLK